MKIVVMIQFSAPVSSLHVLHNLTPLRLPTPPKPSKSSSPQNSLSNPTRRVVVSISSICTAFSILLCSNNTSLSKTAISEFIALPDSSGVKALDLRVGNGELPVNGDQVALHYYGRLAAKQGWRFDSTYDHKDESGEPIPFVFNLGSGKVISGIEVAAKSMTVGRIRRVIVPPSQGYQNTSNKKIKAADLSKKKVKKMGKTKMITIGKTSYHQGKAWGKNASNSAFEWEESKQQHRECNTTPVRISWQHGKKRDDSITKSLRRSRNRSITVLWEEGEEGSPSDEDITCLQMMLLANRCGTILSEKKRKDSKSPSPIRGSLSSKAPKKNGKTHMLVDTPILDSQTGLKDPISRDPMTETK